MNEPKNMEEFLNETQDHLRKFNADSVIEGPDEETALIRAVIFSLEALRVTVAEYPEKGSRAYASSNIVWAMEALQRALRRRKP